ncbi:MAG: hypothetical protein WCV67_00775 [Victivallaceae bacterium]|jgi:hypothetical protein
MALTMLCLRVYALEQISFDKDPYNASVQFAADADAYSLTVAFSPVKLFSGIKNEQINLSKAKIYALTALSRKLKVDKNSALVISGMKAENCQTAENRYSCSLVIPVKDVRIAARVNVPGGSSNPDDLLLNYKESVRKLFIENWREWKDRIERVALDRETADNLSKIEDEINAELDQGRLRQKLESDVMLYAEDVRELQNLSEKVKTDLLTRCEIRLMEFNLKSNMVEDKARYQQDIKVKQRSCKEINFTSFAKYPEMILGIAGEAHT